MEKIEIVGTRKVDFTDDNGRKVNGLSIYYVMDDDNTNGKMAGKLFLSDRRCSDVKHMPAPGDIVWVSYDRYGRPVDFTPVGK